MPGDAHLPAAYVAAEDARLEAYRRLAAATGAGRVDDVADEWADRFGAAAAGPAEGLLALARLRVACLRTGVTDVAVAPARVGGARHPTARLSPLGLAASAQVRLRRLAPGATYREGLGQLVVPVDRDGPAGRGALRPVGRPGAARAGRRGAGRQFGGPKGSR